MRIFSMAILPVVLVSATACEISTNGPVGERHMLNDGTPIYFESTGLWTPASGNDPALNFVLAAAEGGENMFSLADLADRAFEDIVGGTGAKYGWDRIRIAIRTPRQAGLNGPVQSNIRVYEKDESGVWAPRGEESPGRPVDVRETLSIEVGEVEHTVRLLDTSLGYVTDYRSIGRIIQYDCTTCEGDYEATARIAFRLAATEHANERWISEDRIFEVRVFSSTRLNTWHFPMPSMVYFQRSSADNPWPELAVGEDDYVDLVLAQGAHFEAEGRMWRLQATSRSTSEEADSDG